MTTMVVPDRQLTAAKRAEEQAVTRPSDSSGWPEGAKEIQGGPEFRFCFSDEPSIISASYLSTMKKNIINNNSMPSNKLSV